MNGLFRSVSFPSRINRSLHYAAILFGGTAAVSLLGTLAFGLVFNFTHSSPLGWYSEVSQRQIDAHAHNIYVFFCPDIRWPAMKGEPNYREPMRSCPDGFAPLIKPVIAWPGDLVTTSDAGVSVNGALIPKTAPITRDSQGQLLRPYPQGSYRVVPGELWAVSNFSPRSFDSRYFGPIPIRSVRQWLSPLLVERHYPGSK
ncbi:conjugative transfer signal peptidase TraF [Acidisarcina polymorpha]|uniref:conjugative transfer signal peptidase TraF n=1 Tax=Acidisarcina polymorpha TaxID=2211140 RepID=UPI000DF009FF|nr:conjugative transfer signal peptidase TraF [Acidisarcina polymorpha]